MIVSCHLSQLPYALAEKRGERMLFTYQDYAAQEKHANGTATWKEMTCREFADGVKRVSLSLLALGVRVQENIGVFSQNSVPYICTDFGAYGIRAVTIPFYATSSEEQLRYVVNDAQIRLLFVGEQEQYDKAIRVQGMCHSLERIIVYDPAVVLAPHDTTTIRFDELLAIPYSQDSQARDIASLDSELEQRWSDRNETDLVNILYTSGTTGVSKGVTMPYSMYHAAVDANDRCVPVRDGDRVITFLPITHIFERGWDYLSLYEGASLIVNTDPRRIQESMRETNPTCMSAVPRFWEKVYAGVLAKIESASPMKQKLFRYALEVGRKHNVECLLRKKRPSLALSLQYKLIDSTILSLVRKQLGLLQPHIFPTAGARVSPEVETFVHSIGINMLVGYGLTESLATVSCNHQDKPTTVGSVGRPIYNIKVRIADDGEVLLKGPTITPGYYRRDDINAESFTADGYFRTGDAGYMKDGELFLTERIKDLFKTSNGKYVAPQAVEARILVDKFVEQCVIIADERKFVSALIVPSYTELEAWARSMGIDITSREQLCTDPRVLKMLTERFDTLQQGLAAYEQVKRFTLLTAPFTMESGELTNTLKVRRRVVYERYSAEIERMYEE